MIINMTPHDINIIDIDGKNVKTYPASGQLIRLETETKSIGQLPDGTKLTKTTFGSAELPKYDKDVYYVVSGLVKSSFPDRTDFLVPAEMVRDEKNRIIGCKSLGV